MTEEPTTTKPAELRASGTDWAAEAADAIERAVGKVRLQTVDRAHGVTTNTVYGMLAACFVLPALLIAVLLFFRALVALMATFDVQPWLAWVVLGAGFFVAGLAIWFRRLSGVETS